MNFPDFLFPPLEGETCVLLKHISQIHDSFIEMIEDECLTKSKIFFKKKY